MYHTDKQKTSMKITTISKCKGDNQMTKKISKSIIASALMLATLGSTAFAAVGSVNGYMENKSKATATTTCTASSPRYCTVSILQSPTKTSNYTTAGTNSRNNMRNGAQVSKTASVSKSYVRARGVIYNSTSTTSGSTSYSKQLR